MIGARNSLKMRTNIKVRMRLIKFLSFLLLSLFPIVQFCSSAYAASFQYSDLERLIHDNHVHTVEDLLAVLPVSTRKTILYFTAAKALKDPTFSLNGLASSYTETMVSFSWV